MALEKPTPRVCVGVSPYPTLTCALPRSFQGLSSICSCPVAASDYTHGGSLTPSPWAGKETQMWRHGKPDPGQLPSLMHKVAACGHRIVPPDPPILPGRFHARVSAHSPEPPMQQAQRAVGGPPVLTFAPLSGPRNSSLVFELLLGG